MGYSVWDQLKDGFSWGGEAMKDLFSPVGEGLVSLVTTGNPVPILTGGVKGLANFVGDIADTAQGDFGELGAYGALMDAKRKATGGATGSIGPNGQYIPPTKEEMKAAYKEQVARAGVNVEATQAQIAVANAVQAGKTYQSVMNTLNTRNAVAGAQAKAQYAALQKYSNVRAEDAGLSGPADFFPTAAQYQAVKQQRIDAMANAVRASTSFQDEVNTKAGGGVAGAGQSLAPGLQPLGRQITQADMDPSSRYGTMAGMKSYEARIQSGAIKTEGAILSSTYNG